MKIKTEIEQTNNRKTPKKEKTKKGKTCLKFLEAS